MNPEFTARGSHEDFAFGDEWRHRGGFAIAYVGQDVFLTEECSNGNTSTLTYTAEPSGVSVTVHMAGSFRTDPTTGATRFVGAYAIIHVAGGQIVNAGQIDFTFPVDYKGRFDSAPDLELASYAPVVQAFVLLLGAP